MISFLSSSKSWLRLLTAAGATVGLYACLTTQKVSTQAVTASAPEVVSPPAPRRVLVFSKTKGWKHTSIPFGIAAIQKLGQENNFRVDTTKNADYFNDDSLRHYQAVVFMSTTGNVLNPVQQAAFERYIQAGGGYMGVHAAADTEYDWPWYNKLVGAYFSSHPNNSNVRKATVDVTDKSHVSTAHLPDRWERTDEWYNYRSFYSDLNVLANLDENTYDGGTNGSNHPIAWYHEFDGGRAFYTGGGHEDASFSEPLFVKHLLGGLTYTMGKGQPLNYTRSYAVVMPEENRFTKTVLVNDLNEPMELAVVDDGRVFFTERSGNVSVYDTRTSQGKVMHKFAVSTKQGFGVQGITTDPNFATNHFLYLYYSPAVEKDPVYQLSRFVVNEDNTLDLASEKVVLKIPHEFEASAHHGGSFAWDKEGNLYLSTGDNTNPFPSNGYNPIDERPDHLTLDAQRSAANTNDLRGKILRIRPQADGSYTVPDGNLFAKGTAQTRPEIYTMGLRNPYRIAVNPKTSVLYWGEIGPDAGKDSTIGPRGYDEFNQAKTPGNHGWPLFIGDSKPYPDLDFATNVAGPLFDPKAPVNGSPNNTGLKNLPATRPAMIWYPYAASKEFPELGQGGRSAMAGAFYSYDSGSGAKNKFPAYYDGMLFIFDWMRNWVVAARFDKDENYLRTEPFMVGNGDFRRPIDLTFGKDGVMYMLEYGSVYGADNDDARLVKIEYNMGNRAPIAKANVVDSLEAAQANARSFLTSDNRFGPVIREAVGQAPLRVKFSARGTDLDQDDVLTYQWMFDGKTVGDTRPNATYTYTQPGVYNAIVKVTDQTGLSGMDTIVVKVGNARPEVAITTAGNKSFFWPDKPFTYAVKVADKEDTRIDPKRVKVYYAYSAQPGGTPAAVPQQGHQDLASVGNGSLGKNLIANSDCKACHTIDKPSVGPTFLAVASRYKGQAGITERLAKKIIEGGGGNWSKDHLMSAHPQIPAQDAQEMVKYIFSLTDKQNQSTVPPQGTLALKEHKAEEPRGQYTLVATYTDNGGKGVGPLTSTDVVTLRNAKLRAIDADSYVGFPRWGSRLSAGGHKAYLLYKGVDMTGIQSLTYDYSSLNKDGEIEVRLDSYAGPVVSRAPYKVTGDWKTMNQVTGTFDKPITGKHDVYIIAVKRDKPTNEIIQLSSVQFNPY
ncbi:ThuA domain-containing protein [Spirosoma utsteinense]|uniref:Cytochrome c n=1 Tax=Spirosoma utsteinense TaxID=2585773 RepID=A0ABR6WD94_9BACT|nr:ThuA domain-containing protein [Spirosoma utsteinense]MBC3789109.1 cytochrome c [Spirosoma utsteinense]MBC3794527.1 cytochrome c [Spirosoma utsteinense]